MPTSRTSVTTCTSGAMGAAEGLPGSAGDDAGAAALAGLAGLAGAADNTGTEPPRAGAPPGPVLPGSGRDGRGGSAAELSFCPCFYDLLPQDLQALAQRPGRRAARRRARTDHDIHRRQALLQQAETFPNLPSQAIAADRIAYGARRDRQAEPRNRLGIGADRCPQQPVPQAAALALPLL